MKNFRQYNKKTFYRSTRMSKVLKKEISIILHKYIYDPRIKFMTTISMVKLSRDLSHAKIFISYLNINIHSLDDIIDVKNILCILHKSSGYIRKILSTKFLIRKIPILSFYYDNSLVRGIKIFNLLKSV